VEGTDDNNTSGLPEGDHREILEKRKLELEIKQLTSPWWRTPSILAPMTTICVTLFGLFWATATGFFEVSRRELDVRKREVESDIRELTERRDHQTKRFALETAQQGSEIERLRRESASLVATNGKLQDDANVLVKERDEQATRFRTEADRQRRDFQNETLILKTRLMELDQPVLSRVEIQDIASGIASGTAKVSLRGINFGTGRGKIRCLPKIANPDCHPDPGPPLAVFCEDEVIIINELCTIDYWSPVELKFSVNVARLNSANKRPQIIELMVTRSDNKTSNLREMPVPNSWVQPSKTK